MTETRIAITQVTAPLHTLEFVLNTELMRDSWDRIVEPADKDGWMRWCHETALAAYVLRSALVCQAETGAVAEAVRSSQAEFEKAAEGLQALTPRDDQGLARPLLRDLHMRFHALAGRLRTLQYTDDAAEVLYDMVYRISDIASSLMIIPTLGTN